MVDDERVRVGDSILQVYFHQLFSDEPTLLNLGRRAWRLEQRELQWTPGRGHKAWEDGFRVAIRRVYESFYRGTESDLRAALRSIDLEPATDLFIEHFGAGSAGPVRFATTDFVKSFHRIFVRCRDEKIRLHSDFLPLGLYLASLYESLEALDVALDVRSAFERGSVSMPKNEESFAT
ncbi:MAG: hypothetical protein HC923_05385 [Myxococcales bacterium]|nr:hypothetical protein [Myxococcales bacterium]